MHRRLIAVSLVLLAVVILGLTVPAFGQDVTQSVGATATITTGKLNVRSMPTAIAQILTKVDQGAIYPIVGQNNTGKWWQIDVDGIIGWVNGSYVDAKNTADVPITFVDLSQTPGATVAAPPESTPEATDDAGTPAATQESTPEATLVSTPVGTQESTPEATLVSTPALCSGDAFFFDNSTPDLCATGPVMRVDASIQQFENGTMLYRADTGDVYVFGNRGVTLVQSSIYDYLGTPEALTPPEGRLAPDDRFGRVWANISGVRDDLGWATSSVSSYQAIMQSGGFTSTGEKVILIALRNGSIIAADPNTSMWYTVTSG